jgi:hypothetical protein
MNETLTKREQFALHLMTAIVADMGSATSQSLMAKKAVCMADALITALEPKEERHERECPF